VIACPWLRPVLEWRCPGKDRSACADEATPRPKHQRAGEKTSNKRTMPRPWPAMAKPCRGLRIVGKAAATFGPVVFPGVVVPRQWRDSRRGSAKHRTARGFANRSPGKPDGKAIPGALSGISPGGSEFIASLDGAPPQQAVYGTRHVPHGRKRGNNLETDGKRFALVADQTLLKITAKSLQLQELGV